MIPPNTFENIFELPATLSPKSVPNPKKNTQKWYLSGPIFNLGSFESTFFYPDRKKIYAYQTHYTLSTTPYTLDTAHCTLQACPYTPHTSLPMIIGSNRCASAARLLHDAHPHARIRRWLGISYRPEKPAHTHTYHAWYLTCSAIRNFYMFCLNAA